MDAYSIFCLIFFGVVGLGWYFILRNGDYETGNEIFEVFPEWMPKRKKGDGEKQKTT